MNPRSVQKRRLHEEAGGAQLLDGKGKGVQPDDGRAAIHQAGQAAADEFLRHRGGCVQIHLLIPEGHVNARHGGLAAVEALHLLLARHAVRPEIAVAQEEIAVRRSVVLLEEVQKFRGLAGQVVNHEIVDGRANAAVLDQIEVDYYGSPTPIQQVASIATPDPRSLLIQPWDASVLKGIEKAILASDLGINPQNDGRMIRLVFPPLTEERRKDLVKQTKKYGEEYKVAIRNVRREAIEKFKKQQKASEITEDDYKNAEKDIQKLTDDYAKEIDKIIAAKEKELTEI